MKANSTNYIVSAIIGCGTACGVLLVLFLSTQLAMEIREADIGPQFDLTTETCPDGRRCAMRPIRSYYGQDARAQCEAARQQVAENTMCLRKWKPIFSEE